MKSILFVSQSMDFGGVEKSLISILKRIPPNKYDITVLLMHKKGKLLNEIPEWIKVREMPNISKPTRFKILELVKQMKFLHVLKLVFNLIFSMKSKSIYKSYIRYAKILPILKEEYDTAISYSNPTDFCSVYTMNNIIAKKKILWIHSDVCTYKHIYEYENLYSKYNFIYNVSKEGTDRFVNLFPLLQHKVDTFYNLIDENELYKLSLKGETFNDNFHGIRILTVGRLRLEKGQDFIPKILKEIVKLNKNIKWYCIGNGDLRDELELDIKKYGLEDKLILLGAKSNPYGYIKDCDIYVQPSRNECYCTTVTEAKCFNRPMVITNVNGSKEQIKNNYNGLIVDIDEQSILEGIIKLIDKKEIRDKFINNLSKENISTIYELDRLYELLD